MVVGVMVVASLVVGGLWYWDNQQNKEIEVSEERLPPPKELNNEFDPRESEAVFQINEIEVENRQLELEFVWPENRVGRKVVSTITCQDGEIQVESKSEEKTRKVSWVELSESGNIGGEWGY